MPRITVDDVEIEVPAGKTLLQALDDVGLLMNGVEIPHYCWHPKLSIDGSCRLCQVEIQGMPKLQIACNTPVTEGMVVRTQVRIRPPRAGRRDGAAAREPPARLPDLRPGGRVQAPGLRLRVRRGGVAHARAAPRAREERLARAHHRLRPGALHPVPPLRALLPRDHGHRRARGPESRRSLGDRDRSRRPARERLLDERGRHLPGGRAHHQGLPLQDPRLVPGGRAGRLHRLQQRLQHLPRRREQQGLPLPAAPQRRGERHLDLRLRPHDLPRDRSGRPAPAARSCAARSACRS